jgi:hypothetical protein
MYALHNQTVCHWFNFKQSIELIFNCVYSVIRIVGESSLTHVLNFGQSQKPCEETKIKLIFQKIVSLNKEIFCWRQKRFIQNSLILFYVMSFFEIRFVSKKLVDMYGVIGVVFLT